MAARFGLLAGEHDPGGNDREDNSEGDDQGHGFLRYGCLDERQSDYWLQGMNPLSNATWPSAVYAVSCCSQYPPVKAKFA